MKFTSRHFWMLPCLVLMPQVLHAQQDASEQKIEPDRRDFATGTGIVPRAHVQIESGATTTRRGSQRDYSLGEVLVRVPVAERAELRFGVPSYLVQRQGTRQTGADDSMLEARFLLSKKEKSEFGLQFSSTLPTGSRRVAERRLQPQAIAAASFTLSKRAGLVVDGGIRSASENQQRFTQLFAAASLRYDVSDKVNAFAEVYGFNKQEAGGAAQRFAAVGAVYFLSPRTALDARVGFGLGNKVGGPDYLCSAGLSRLF